MNRILKLSRLEGLTDGIFAVAMTILVLDLRLPVGVLHDKYIGNLMDGIYLKLVIYSSSFIILGTLWIAMNFQWSVLNRLNRLYLWCNMFYLMVICVVPFSASFVAAYPNSQISLSFYAINLLCAYGVQLLICECAHRYQLNGEKYTPTLRRAIIQRIFVAPPFFILSLIAASFSTTIAFILIVIPTLVYMMPGHVDRIDKD